ncbi:hypothetical protein FRX31_030516 [Thalictrum thalictroides]|uniref:No apical meristem-associated C-terminal domain-containing protein n=1 Tax=Thalictrum thalictroides TaxID=46969 RepID=A0A7J6V5D5_THATH|nr:hypothetical protein FRX31_030516 [Thalictrum thalictroides]
MTSRALSRRGASFTSVEDTILCKAYCLHSSNYEIGLYRNKEAMWNKIESTYNEEACDQLKFKLRTVSGLQSRWRLIYGACKLFWECIRVDKLKGARVSYMRRHPKQKAFTFDHVWEILKAHEKWIEHPEPIEQQDSNSPVVKGADEEDDNIQQQAHLEFREKMKQRRADYWARANALLDIEKKMLEIEHQKLDIKEQKSDKKIMDMDLSDLTPMKKMYFTNRKLAIASKQNKNKFVEEKERVQVEALKLALHTMTYEEGPDYWHWKWDRSDEYTAKCQEVAVKFNCNSVLLSKQGDMESTNSVEGLEGVVSCSSDISHHSLLLLSRCGYWFGQGREGKR